MSQYVLTVSNLRGGYGRKQVLRDAGLMLASGEISGVIGPNGAGKTTLLRAIYGLLELDAGTITYDGSDITKLPARSRLLQGIGYVPQERNVFPSLSVSDNLDLALNVLSAKGDAHGRKKRREFVFDLFPRLAERRNQPVGVMSGGEQRMVAISLGLVSRPRVLLLDEPTTGLAPVVVHQLMEKIQALNRTEGISTVIVEQNVLSLLEIVQSVYIVKDGHARRFEGRPKDLSKREIWEYM